MKKSKLAVIVFTLVFVLGFIRISNASELNMNLQCPDKVAPGGQLDVNIQASNSTFSGIFVRSLGTGIIGNPSGNSGFPVIYGP